jgi:hypothetical protein
MPEHERPRSSGRRRSSSGKAAEQVRTYQQACMQNCKYYLSPLSKKMSDNRSKYYIAENRRVCMCILCPLHACTQRRRDKINDKMRTLQQLMPTCSKVLRNYIHQTTDS